MPATWSTSATMRASRKCSSTGPPRPYGVNCGLEPKPRATVCNCVAAPVSPTEFAEIITIGRIEAMSTTASDFEIDRLIEWDLHRFYGYSRGGIGGCDGSVD